MKRFEDAMGGQATVTPVTKPMAPPAAPVVVEPAPVRPFGPRLAEPLLARQVGARAVADKLRRRVRKLAGKPDNSPWVLRPGGGGTRTTYVDFIYGLDYVSVNSRLVRIMHEAMAARGLSVLLTNTTNVEQVTRQIETGWLQPYVYLDLASSSDARFNDLALAAAGKGIYVVDEPQGLTSWTHKAPAHEKLLKAGLPLPPSVILRKGEADRDLTPAERELVGERVVIKPSNGFGNRGVVVGAEPTKERIATARAFDRNDDWLVQRMIKWTRLGDRPAYVRAYHVLGHRSLLWWCKEGADDYYDLLTWEDLHRYDLMPAVELVDRVATVSGLDFFSSEVAITKTTGADRFVLIDYVNDQCDMDPEVRPGTSPVPEPWIRWVCERFAEFAWRAKTGQPRDEQRTLTLF